MDVLCRQWMCSVVNQGPLKRRAVLFRGPVMDYFMQLLLEAAEFDAEDPNC